MYDVIDIANWFIGYNETKRKETLEEDIDEINNYKLQKLLYYAQSATLTIKGKPLFNEDIKHKEYGPIIHKVYEEYKHYGSSGITEYDIKKANNIKDKEIKNLLINVYNIFSEYSSIGLRNISLSDYSCKSTKLNQIITHDKMIKSFKEKYTK